jgi:hypothetical protein
MGGNLAGTWRENAAFFRHVAAKYGKNWSNLVNSAVFTGFSGY